jgi:hypothetical protein
MPAKTAWAHLPNAQHIDAVLADVKARPEVWTTARDVAWTTARSAVQDAAWDAVRAAAWATARGAVRDAVRDAVWGAVWGAAWDAARDAAWGALAALIAWDSSADLLECTPDVLRTMIDLAEPPVCHQAVLLLPYAIVRSNAKQEVT